MALGGAVRGRQLLDFVLARSLIPNLSSSSFTNEQCGSELMVLTSPVTSTYNSQTPTLLIISHSQQQYKTNTAHRHWFPAFPSCRLSILWSKASILVAKARASKTQQMPTGQYIVSKALYTTTGLLYNHHLGASPLACSHSTSAHTPWGEAILEHAARPETSHHHAHLHRPVPFAAYLAAAGTPTPLVSSPPPSQLLPTQFRVPKRRSPSSNQR